MIAESEAECVEEWIQAAVQAGGTLLCGRARQGAILEATRLE